jgi:hypothetical protein
MGPLRQSTDDLIRELVSRQDFHGIIVQRNKKSWHVSTQYGRQWDGWHVIKKELDKGTVLRVLSRLKEYFETLLS